jgi:hypothetical protein
VLLGLLDCFGLSDWALNCGDYLDVDSVGFVQENTLKRGVLRVLGLRWCKSGCLAAWLGIVGDMTGHGDFDEDGDEVFLDG